MVLQTASAEGDPFVASYFRSSLSAALLDSISRHLLSIFIGLFPALLFILRCVHSSLISSRLIRFLLSLSSLLYFPFLSLWTSIVITILTFLLRRTDDVEALLHRLCAAVIDPLVDRFAPSGPIRAVSLEDLHSHLRQSSTAVLRREALVAKMGRRSPLRALVRVLTTFVMRAALAALSYVTESRFQDALASVAPSRPKQLSPQVVIAILRGEMVSALLLPFKASVKMYLYGTLVVAALLMAGPIWLLW